MHHQKSTLNSLNAGRSFFRGVAAVLAVVSSASAQVPPPPEKAATEIRVQLLDEAGLRSLLGARKGRPLLVNVWATWCAPCVEEFPALVKIDSIYRKRGLDVATISIDFEDEVEGKVLPFLKRQRARMSNFVNAFPTPSALINAIDSTWSGAIPAAFLVNERGMIVRSAIGVQSYEGLSRLAESLLFRKRPRR